MDNTENKTNGANKMSSKTKITLGAMFGGSFSTGDSRNADILLNGVSIGEIEVQANHLVSEGVLSFSGDRYSASDIATTIYPAEFGIVGFEGELNHIGKPKDYIEHNIDMFNLRGLRIMTSAQAKREARQWVADTVKSLRAEAVEA